MKGRAKVATEAVALRLHSWGRSMGLRTLINRLKNGYEITWEPAT